MFIKYERTRNRKTGAPETYLCVVEGYRDSEGRTKLRRIKSYGCLEKRPDREAFIAAIEAEIPLLEKQFSVNIGISLSAEENDIFSESNTVYNYGYKYLESVYSALGMDKYFTELQDRLGKKVEYKIRDIFKFLVFERILHPDSKRASLERIHEFFGQKNSFSLDDIYRCMTLIEPYFEEVQDRVKAASDRIIKRDYSRIFYDCTNYYCEIDFNDSIENLRHRGVSKEHRVDPIVGFGLFMDNNGLPLKCQVFNGNVAEGTTLIPGIRAVKAAHSLGKVILVADKGLNSSKNIEELVKNGDGYVFSQVLRGGRGKRFHEHILSDEGYQKTVENGLVTYKEKSFIEDYEYTDKDGRSQKAKRRALIYYSLSDDFMAKRKRAEKLCKAENSLNNNAYGIIKGYSEYLKEDIIDSRTGEILNENVIKSKSVNSEKVALDEQFDGYFCLITSETDWSNAQIREAYNGLWEIEQTFRITKTDLEFRPIYHFKKENIRTHFLVCFCAVLVLRMLQHSLKRKGVHLSAERIVTALNDMTLQNIKGIVRLSKPATTQSILDFKAINSAFSITLSHMLLRLETLRHFFSQLTFT